MLSAKEVRLYTSITKGEVASPNYPANYPDRLDKKEQITVESGKILRLEFTHFAVWACYNIATCLCGFVKITDGDGTTLMDNSCGYSSSDFVDPSHSLYFQPPILTTKTNRVEIYFHTNDKRATSGWSLRWTAVAEGECYHRVCLISTSDCPPACPLANLFFCQKKNTFRLLLAELRYGTTEMFYCLLQKNILNLVCNN